MKQHTYSSNVQSSAPSIKPFGVWPVLLTPYTTDNKIDFPALESLMAFYIQAGVTGIFANCLSSELFFLSSLERRQIVRHLVACNANKIPIVAGANFGSTLEEQAASLQEFSEMGIDAAVIILSLLPESEHMYQQVEELISRTTCTLGIYECPLPHHRLLTAEEVRLLSRHDRISFMKETSRNVAEFGRKLEAVEGSQIKLLQANLLCLPDSVEMGALGMCGIIANVCPELTVEFCLSPRGRSGHRKRVYSALLRMQEVLVSQGYPSSAKYVLNRRGLPIQPASRTPQFETLSNGARQELNAFLDGFNYTNPELSDLDRVDTRSQADSAEWLD